MWPFKKPITASEAGRLGNMVKKDRARARYVEFHNRMAEKAGTEIRWSNA